MVPPDVMSVIEEEVRRGTMTAPPGTSLATRPKQEVQAKQEVKPPEAPQAPVPLDLEPTFPEPIRTEFKLLARFRIHSPEMSVPEVANRMGFNAQTVRNWLKNPQYQRYENFVLGNTLGDPRGLLPRSKQEVTERFCEFTGEMQDRLYDIISTTKNERLQAQLVKDWLAYGGHRLQDDRQKGGLNIIMTPEAMREFLTRAREAGLVVDGSIIE